MTMEPVEALPTPAPYQGGKRHLAERICQRIQAIPHDFYAEPFVGMGGVFFRRRRRPPIEAINDISRDVATFFRMLQRHPRALLEELRFRIPSRAEYDRLKAQDPDLLTDLERAARFYYLQRLAYSGKVAGRSFLGAESKTRADIAGRLRTLERIHGRLGGVIVECLSYAEFIQRYDRPTALFYLDPPYWGGEADYGKGMFGRVDFYRLVDILAGLKGRFLLSINDVPDSRALFGRFHLESVETIYTVGDSDAGAPRRELIVSDGPRAGDVGTLL
jgi:DNA adenine methylase